MKSSLNFSKEQDLIVKILFQKCEINKKDFININLDKIILILSSHLMLPAFYSCCKKKKILKFLPDPFTKYIKKIYEINKQRNKLLLNEMELISKFLQQSKINFVFLKGSSLIYQKIYSDIGERMIGDIDILIEDKRRKEVINLLKSNNYKSKFIYKVWKANVDPNFINKNRLFSIDLHNNLFPNNYNSLMNSIEILNNAKESRIRCMDLGNEILYNIYNYAVSDYSYLKCSYSFRKFYDIKKLFNKFKFDQFEKDNIIKDFFMKGKLLGVFENEKINLENFNKFSRIRFITKHKNRKLYYLDDAICKFLIFFKLFPKRFNEFLFNKDYKKNIIEKF